MDAIPVDGVRPVARNICKLRLTFPRDFQTEALRPGDELVFRGYVRKPKNRGNPEEFDYAEYLSVKGVSGLVYIGSGQWRLCKKYDGWNRNLSLWDNLRIKALRWRDGLSGLYRDAGLQGQVLALYAALTLGDKSGLTEDLREVYSGVGVSHILALSGMHLGFLVAVFNLFLLRYIKGRRVRRLAVVLAVALVWGYAFLTGRSPSLVRAAAMYSLMLCGSLLGRSGFSVNSLAVSAALMLCFSPAWLYDVGFQLSFLSMWGILIICPRFVERPLMRSRYVGWVFQSLMVSFAAQMFTVPLVAYCFGTFSLYSALATLVITPVTALLIYAMPLLFLAYFWGRGSYFLSDCIRELVVWQNGYLRMMMKWPGAVMRVDWSLWWTVLCYVALFFCTLGPFRRYETRVKAGFIWAILLMCAFVANRRFVAVRPEIIFYNNPSSPAVHVVYSSSRSYLFPTRTDSVYERMSYIASSFWIKKLSEKPRVITDDFKDDYISSVSGLVGGRGGVSFLTIADNRWSRVRSKKRAEVDFLYVCRGYQGSLSELSRLFCPRCVVLDASLWRGARRRYIRECVSLGWSFYDMEAKGALKVALN